MLLGLALHAAADLPRGHLATAIVAVLVLVAGIYLQSILYINQLGGEAPRNIEAVEELTRIDPATTGRTRSIYHLVNVNLAQLAGPEDRVYTEGVSAPFYFDDLKRVDYHSPWDASPIGPVLRARGGPGARAWLEQNGYAMVIVDNYWITRHLGRTFTQDKALPGYDPNIDLQSLQALDSALQPVSMSERQTVYAVPQRR
jgi:hypothetical protein